MNNENRHIEIGDLIGKYLSGEASGEEIGNLERWVRAGEDNAKVFADYKKLWITAGIRSEMSSTETDSAWQLLKSKLPLEHAVAGKSEEAAKVRRLMPLLRYAAVIVILAAITGILYYMFSKPHMEELSASGSVISKTLSDGSEVTLNLGSKISYPSVFKGSNRTLTLDGDAFFNVEPDKSKPFIVQAGDAEITVLGTSFYVSAKPDDPKLEVIVGTGKVSLKSGTEEVILAVGEKGTYDKSAGTVQKEVNQDENYISWKTKRLVFQDERLEAVFQKIEQNYGVKIRVQNPEIHDCRLTATFENQPAEAVIEIIGATFGFEVSARNGEIQVSGTGCSK